VWSTAGFCDLDAADPPCERVLFWCRYPSFGPNLPCDQVAFQPSTLWTWFFTLVCGGCAVATSLWLLGPLWKVQLGRAPQEASLHPQATSSIRRQATSAAETASCSRQ